MSRWIKLPTVSAVRFMWASARNTLENRLVADAVVVAFLGAFRALLGVAALECLVSNLLAVVALCRSRSMFKGAGYARFSPSVEEPLVQKSSCIGVFGQVDHH
jgi:hypothetical protein